LGRELALLLLETFLEALDLSEERADACLEHQSRASIWSGPWPQAKVARQFRSVPPSLK